MVLCRREGSGRINRVLDTVIKEAAILKIRVLPSGGAEW